MRSSLIVIQVMIIFSIIIFCGHNDVKAMDEVDEIEVIRQQREKNLTNLTYPSQLRSATIGNCPIVNTITATDDDSGGLAWDAGNLWVSEGGNADIYKGMIFKIDTNGNILSSFTAPGQNSQGPRPKGLAFDGTYLWNVDYLDDKIYKLTKSGNIISSISVPSGISSGLAWDGENLWVSEWFSYKIYKIDPANGQILKSFNAPDFEDKYPYGLAWDGTHLWVSNSNGIYMLDPETASVLASCTDSDVKYGKAYGLTWDGQYLWGGSWISDSIIKIDVSNLLGQVNPFPDVKVNGSDGPVNVTPGDNLSITGALNSGSSAGQSADWWAYADTPFGRYYYDVIGGSWSWLPGFSVTYQGALFDLGTMEVLNISGLPTGTYTVYFEIDMNMNGIRDGQIYSDSVVVNISTATAGYSGNWNGTWNSFLGSGTIDLTLVEGEEIYGSILLTGTITMTGPAKSNLSQMPVSGSVSSSCLTGGVLCVFILKGSVPGELASCSVMLGAEPPDISATRIAGIYTVGGACQITPVDGGFFEIQKAGTP